MAIRCFRCIAVLLAAILFAGIGTGYAAAAAEPVDQKEMLLEVGDALVNSGEQNWAAVAEHLAAFEKMWQVHRESSKASPEAAAIDEALRQAKQEASATPAAKEKVSKALSNLAKATNAFLSSQQKNAAPRSGKAAARELVPLLEQSLSAVQKHDLAGAKASYNQLTDKWQKVESPIRAESFHTYSAIETKMSLVRIALNTEPPRPDKIEKEIRDLLDVLDQYAKGTLDSEPAAAQETDTITMEKLIQVLEQAAQNVQSGKYNEAADNMQTFIQWWPAAEGEIRTRSPQTYADVETKMTEVPGALLSTPPDSARAENLIQTLKESLLPYRQQSEYTVWDAGLILLREGLEALLVIAALLAFLDRTGNRAKRVWIWTGVGAGVVASCGIAVLLNLFLTQATAGGSSEAIEGYTGIISVILMVTVGAWLHKKSNVQAWNQYIKEKVGSALSRGTLWSLAAISFFALMREGTETVIFYLGMAASIQLSQLVLGVAGAALILIVLGFAILRFSARIPIRPFFLCASLMIYYLAFKYVGVSIHALQIVGKIPTHAPGYLPTLNWLGLYPTWETTVPQLFVLLVIVAQILWNERQSPIHRIAKKVQKKFDKRANADV